MVDFKTLYQLQAPEEERLFEEAVARAQAGDEEARAHLARSRGEAAQTGGAISMTGSYSDYVQAQRKAQEAWRNATRSDSAVGAALRQNRDAEGMARGAAEETAARRGNLSEWAASDYAQSQREVKARKEWEAAQAAEAAQREAKDAQAFKTAREQLQGEIEGFWAEQDRQANTFGFGNPHGWAVDQYRGPAEWLSGGWKQRAAGLGMDLPDWQTREQRYMWGKRSPGGSY